MLQVSSFSNLNRVNVKVNVRTKVKVNVKVNVRTKVKVNVKFKVKVQGQG